MSIKRVFLLFLAWSSFSETYATEGMFTPEQLPSMATTLAQAGLRLPPQQLASINTFPLAAMVDLSGCSGSFVSDRALVVTNYHCVEDTLEFNSSEQNNYIENGFLANRLEQELPAPPGTAVYVTVQSYDVTSRVLAGLEGLQGQARTDALEMNQKMLIAECEMDAGHRCDVPAFFGGKEYKLVKQLQIKDVRLVYAPPHSMGRYGGETDNWVWPRHSADFAFYRAYVGKDGRPAEYSPNNVPFSPQHHLSVSVAPLTEGDFVMSAGFPSWTNRYARAAEISYVFNWLYPTYVSLVDEWIDVLEQHAPRGSEARTKYSSRLNSLYNFLKNTEGQLSGAHRSKLIENRLLEEQQMGEWLAQQPSMTLTTQFIAALDNTISQRAVLDKRNYWYENVKRSQMLNVAQTLYRYAIEREKPDEERALGFQNRDRVQLEQQMMRLDSQFDATVDKAQWLFFIQQYAQRPANERVPALDNALSINSSSDRAITNTVDQFYRKTQLTDVDQRLALLKRSRQAFEESDDPFIQLAISLHPTDIDIENAIAELTGAELGMQQEYMQAIVAWKQAQGLTVYPDANGTLRVSYGEISGGSPRDGITYRPFTTLEGIVEKHTGRTPFNSPKKQLDLIANQVYGEYIDNSLNSVPVNFITNLDTTSGSSGSATLNASGELVGLVFDGTIESVNSDWDFDARITRSIHVDVRYMLWVLQNVEGASNLIREMDVVGQGR